MYRKIKVLFVLFSTVIFSQDDQKIIKKIFDTCMNESKTYEMLDYLSNEIGGRLSGSLNADRAVDWGS